MATTTTIRGITYNAGNTFTTRSGYWYGSADGGQGSGSVTSGKTVTFYEDRTGWADWYYHPILCKGGGFNGGDYFWTDKSIFPYASVTVTFNANGGSAVSNQTYTWTDASSGVAGNFPSTTRTGYKHTGWTISGTTYSATSNVINSWISARNGQTVTATAVWEAQASPISSVGAITYGTGTSTTGSVTWTPYNSTYRYAIKAELGSKSLVLPASGYITPNSTNPYTYNFSFDSSWINQVPNSKQGTVTYTLYTYTSTGTSNIGYATKTATITVPTNIKPSVSIGSITTANTPTFTGKIVTGVDKFSIPWTYDNSSDYSSPLASLTCVANGETLTVTSGTSGNIQTNNYIQAYGPQIITVDCKDARGNSAIQASATVNVYWYFAPQITAKYEHNANGYFVNVTGKIAYVNGSNAKSLTLNIKDKDGTITGTHDLTSLIGAHISDSGQNNYIYDHIYPIGISYQITDVDNEIPNIVSETYSFEVIATDTVYTGSNSIKSTSVSGISVMTFGAGGTDITAHKPMTFEQGVQTGGNINDSAGGLELLPIGMNSVGGKVKFDAGASGQANVYVDNYNDQFRILSAGSNIFSWDLVEPYKMYMRTSSLTSSDNLDNFTYNFMDAWCNNVQSKPSGSGQYGRVVTYPFIQVYYEFLGQTTSPYKIWTRMHVNSAWTTWQAITTSASMYNFVVDWGVYGAWRWRKWNNGDAECWTPDPYHFGNVAISTGYGNGYYTYKENLSFPSSFFTDPPALTISSLKSTGLLFVSPYKITKDVYSIYIGSLRSETAANIYISAHAFGKWK